MLVKIAPDLDEIEIAQIADSFVSTGIDGVIATDTTLDRSMVVGQLNAEQAGGLSGAVLKDKSQSVVKKLNEVLDGAIPIIGVGGIDSALSGKARIVAGSSLIQIYSGLIYKGPNLIKEIVEGI